MRPRPKPGDTEENIRGGFSLERSETRNITSAWIRHLGCTKQQVSCVRHWPTAEKSNEGVHLWHTAFGPIPRHHRSYAPLPPINNAHIPRHALAYTGTSRRRLERTSWQSCITTTGPALSNNRHHLVQQSTQHTGTTLHAQRTARSAHNPGKPNRTSSTRRHAWLVHFRPDFELAFSLESANHMLSTSSLGYAPRMGRVWLHRRCRLHLGILP